MKTCMYCGKSEGDLIVVLTLLDEPTHWAHETCEALAAAAAAVLVGHNDAENDIDKRE